MKQASHRHTELEGLLERVEKQGERALDFEEAEQLGRSYRHAATQLAETRAIGHQKRRRTYLEALVNRAHYVVYPAPRTGLRPVIKLFVDGFPRAFRDTWILQLTAIALIGVGTVIGYLATMSNPEVAYPLIGAMYPPEIVQSLIESDEARRTMLSLGRGSGAGERSLFAAGLLANNSRVTFVAFSLGIAAGLPTILVHTFNGALLGSFMALFARGGLVVDFLAWALPHAVPEVLALCIGTAAGLRIGLAVIAPGARPRREVIARAGRQSATLIGFAVLLLVYAAIVEAFFRQSNLSNGPRLALAAFNFVVISAYLTLAGPSRGRREAPA